MPGSPNYHLLYYKLLLCVAQLKSFVTGPLLGFLPITQALTILDHNSPLPNLGDPEMIAGISSTTIQTCLLVSLYSDLDVIARSD